MLNWSRDKPSASFTGSVKVDTPTVCPGREAQTPRNPCPAKAKRGQYPVSGGTRHQHAEKQSRQGRLSALLPGRLCYSGGGRSLFAANEKGSPLPRCFYAPPGGVGRAEALKKTGSAFPTSQEGKSTGQK